MPKASEIIQWKSVYEAVKRQSLKVLSITKKCTETVSGTVFSFISSEFTIFYNKNLFTYISGYNHVELLTLHKYRKEATLYIYVYCISIQICIEFSDLIG